MKVRFDKFKVESSRHLSVSDRVGGGEGAAAEAEVEVHSLQGDAHAVQRAPLLVLYTLDYKLH